MEVNSETTPKALAEFDLAYSNAKTLRDVIDAVHGLVDEASVEVTQEGIGIREMDPSHVALVDLRIPAAGFYELRIEKAGTVGVGLDNLLKVLSRARGDERVRIRTDGNKLAVEYPDTRRSFWVGTSELERSELPDPKIDFRARMTTDPGELLATLKDIEANDFYLARLAAENGTVEISASGDREVERYAKVFDDTQAAIRCDGGQVASYDPNYLKRMTTTKLGPVTLEWSTTMPLRVTYNIGNGGELRFLLAPRVTDDEATPWAQAPSWTRAEPPNPAQEADRAGGV